MESVIAIGSVAILGLFVLGCHVWDFIGLIKGKNNPGPESDIVEVVEINGVWEMRR